MIAKSHSRLGLGLVFFFVFALEAGQNCLSSEAIWRMRSVADPQVSPDGKSILFVHSWNDLMDDSGYSNVRRIPIGGGEPRAITEGKYHDSSPRWSPDGARVAYVSNRSGRQAIHIRVLATSQDRVVVRDTERIANLAWSPDGKFLAYTAFAASQPAWAPAMPAQPAGAQWAPPPVAITDLRWTFDGIGVLKPGATRIFIVPVSGAAPRQISRDP